MCSFRGEGGGDMAPEACICVYYTFLITPCVLWCLLHSSRFFVLAREAIEEAGKGSRRFFNEPEIEEGDVGKRLSSGG